MQCVSIFRSAWSADRLRAMTQRDSRFAQIPKRLPLFLGDEAGLQPLFYLEGLLPESADRQHDGQEEQSEHEVRFGPELFIDEKPDPEEKKGANDNHEPPGTESQDVGEYASFVCGDSGSHEKSRSRTAPAPSFRARISRSDS